MAGDPTPAFDDWPVASAASVGFNEGHLFHIDDAYGTGKLPNLHSVVVARDGHIVFERYFTGEDEVLGTPLGEVQFDAHTLHDLRSVSKSIVGLLYGVALTEGLVPGLDAVLVDQFPAFTDLIANPERRRMTVEHALTMQLGIEWDETLPYTDPRNGEIAMENAPDRYRFILERPMVDAPGTHWNYCGGATALLGHMIAIGSGISLLDYARSRLFAPLGIEDLAWTLGSNGEPAAAAGLRMRPRDLAKIGHLILSRGAWGRRQIVPTSWLERIFVSRAKTSFGLDYGYHWYMANTEGVSWVAGNGNGGQHLFIARELDLVFVCTAGNYNQWSRPNIPVELRKLILAAIK